MGRRTIAGSLLFALAAAPAVASEPSLHAGVAAGGGWDSNLSGGSSGATPIVASGYGTGNAFVGVAIEPSRNDELSLELGWDGTKYLPRYADLDVQRPYAELGWIRDVGDRLTLRIGPTAGWIVAGTRARSGWDAGGTAAARLQLGRGTALRLGAGYRHRESEDPAFASDSFRGKGAFELDLRRGSTVSATYTIDVGQDTFYAPVQPVASASIAAMPVGGYGGGGGIAPGGRTGSPVSTFGTALIAYSADRVAHTAGLRLVQRFQNGIALEAGYSYAVVLSDAQDYRAHAVAVELGWRR